MEPASYVRIRDITSDPGRGRLGILPIRASTWWSWVDSGKAPQPIRLSAGCTIWRRADVLKFIEAHAESAQQVSQ